MNRETAKWVDKAEADWQVAQRHAREKPPRDIVCFHCQQAAEKYVKALLQESGRAVPRTNEIAEIIELLLPSDKSLGRLRQRADSLSQYAVNYRSPGMVASKRQMEAALRHADRIRLEIRTKLNLAP